jgi:RNA-binding motif protein, X-linked 2
MNSIREIQKINAEELKRGIAGTAGSWHAHHAHSSWVYVGNLDHALTEGDVLCVLSQYGELEDIHLVRDEETGQSRGFAFCKYQDARSCVLAVDNFCGIQLCGRSLRVDHVENYRLPKHILEKREEGADPTVPGMAYVGKDLSNEYSLQRGVDIFAPRPLPLSPPLRNEAARLPDEEEDRRRQAKATRKQEREKKRLAKVERRKRKGSRAERHRRKRARRYSNGSRSQPSRSGSGSDDRSSS